MYILYAFSVRSHCPEARVQNYIQDKERKEQEELEDQKNKKFVQPCDPIKEAHAKMNQLAQEGPNGQLPKQRNLMKLAFEINENYGQYGESLRMIIEAPKFVDTSQMIVDIHPLWMQAQIKSHLLLIHLPCEINVNQSIVRRIVSTGWLELIMPKTNWEISIKTSNSKVLKKHIDIVDSFDNYDCDDNNTISEQDKLNAEKYQQEKNVNNSGMIDLDNDKSIKSDWDFDESEVPPLE